MIRPGHGESVGTLDKERKIGSALHVSMTAADAIARRNRLHCRYFHFDANAGCGWNAVANCPGTPLVYACLAEKQLHQLRPSAVLCDVNAAQIDQLRRRLKMEGYLSPDVEVVLGDNRSHLRMFANFVRAHDQPEYALGTVIFDPNGWFWRSVEGVGVPVEEAIAFTREFPRIDIVININCFHYWRMRGQPHKFPNLLAPGDVLHALNKKHWLVSNTFAGHGRFFLAVGRNYPFGDHKALGLYHWDSLKGQEEIARADNDRERLEEFRPQREEVEQLTLFGA